MTWKRPRARGAFSLVLAASMVPPMAFADTIGVTPSPQAHSQTGSPTERAPTAVLLPTLVSTEARSFRRPWRRPSEEETLAQARALDSTLADALQELGFILDVSDRSGGLPREPSEVELLERARELEAFVVLPHLENRGSDLLVRILVAPPDSPVLRVRVEEVDQDALVLRGAVMLRDLTVGKSGAALRRAEASQAHTARAPALAIPARSAGRATLALNAALFGGSIGYSIQRSSGSDDPRLLYPLMALGTGMGLGASMIIAEEWDVGIGDAWYLSAGAWWPAAAGLLIAKGNERLAPERYSYGIGFAGAGLGLATVALTFKGMGEGGALLTHSGGAFGTALGGLTELAIRGSTDSGTPYSGMGYGAAGGVVLAGVLATQVRAPSSRVLGLDIGAGLGGLAGAAITSPFLFGDRTEGRDRAFLIATMAGTITGGAIGWLVAPSESRATPRAEVGAPLAGVVGASQAKDGSLVPVLGIGWQGAM